MMQRRSWIAGAALTVAALVVTPACKRAAEVNPIVPSIEINRAKAPLGSAIEVTYTWTLEPGARKLGQDYRVLVHFLDSHKVVLFTDDHLPPTPTTAWEAGKTVSYKRTVFIPVYPYVGDVTVAMGLYPAQGKGERVMLKGEDIGLRAFKVAKMEFQPQTENIFLVYKDGWHNPESTQGVERTWTKKDALVSFKNPKKDVVIYLEADTCVKCFTETPVLTLTVGNKAGLTIPIPNADVFLKKIHVKADDLGTEEWADIRLSMNQSFVPKNLTPPQNDERELGLMVSHLFVAEADKLGTLPEGTVVETVPMTVTLPVPAKATPAKGAAVKGAPTPAPAKPAGKPTPKPAAKKP
jgi:hypothetical protein